MKSEIIIGNCSDVGKVRQVNEDYFASFHGRFGSLTLVCDGMGGHKGGELASRIAVEAIRNYFDGIREDADPKKELLESLKSANSAILQESGENPDLEGMGSTVVLLLIKGDQAYCAHIGDSRIYLIRDGKIHQITKDHSLVQQLIDANIISPEEAKNHPKKNVITKSLGIDEQTLPDITEPIALFRGDRFVLCTDGLTGMVQDNEIMQEAAGKEVQQACRNLVELANKRGGKDNITVQILEIRKGKKLPKRLSPWKKTAIAIAAIIALGSALFCYLFCCNGQQKYSKRQGIKTYQQEENKEKLKQPPIQKIPE